MSGEALKREEYFSFWYRTTCEIMERKHPGSTPKNADDANFSDEDKETITEVMARFLAVATPSPRKQGKP